MRSINLIAIVILLASCGNPRSESGSDPVDGPGTNSLNEANAAEGANVETVAQANNSVADANSGSASPCLMQGADRLDIRPFRAVGTEPFWSARVEGRCVTYSTPENQQGSRVWTRYSAGPNGGGVWAGQLGGKKFELRTRLEAACSDGMSDKRYPMAAELLVDDEQRAGCAEPL